MSNEIRMKARQNLLQAIRDMKDESEIIALIIKIEQLWWSEGYTSAYNTHAPAREAMGR